MSLILLSGPTTGAPVAVPSVAQLVPTFANAASSALGLGDLALVWGVGVADLVMIDSDIASDRGITTAVLLSMMLDRRAQPDDVVPSGDARDRRGWWADQFLPVEGDRYGSRLWLLDRTTLTNETARKADEYTREALNWMLEDRVVSRIDVPIETTRNAMLIGVGLQRPGRDPISFRFAHTWDHLTT